MEKIYSLKSNNLSTQRLPASDFFKAVFICLLFLLSLISAIKFCETFVKLNPIILSEIGVFDREIPNYKLINIETITDIESALKEYNLWDVEKDAIIPPVIFNRYPIELNNQSVQLKKKIFFNTLLPIALIAQKEVSKERQYLLSIINNLESSGFKKEDIVFDESNEDWQKVLNQFQLHTSLTLSKKYRSSIAQELLTRIDTIPASLILAQAAIESAWGTSRFAVDGNNLFGIWTWSKPGIIPHLRETGKKHKVAIYNSLIDSVRAYILTINRGNAYAELRVIRQKTANSLKLADGLLNYSARRGLYIDEVKSMIRINKLQPYDSCILTAHDADLQKMSSI